MTKVYAKLSLDELRTLANALPAPTDNRAVSEVMPLYMGAASPAMNNPVNNGPREVEGGPAKLDVNELASPGLLSFLGKQRRA